MRLENLLRGMMIPGEIPDERRTNMTTQLTAEQKSLFLIQNLVDEIVRLNKVIGRMKGRDGCQGLQSFKE